jgi:hypothetical protein
METPNRISEKMKTGMNGTVALATAMFAPTMAIAAAS